jgi:hypothetical protein
MISHERSLEIERRLARVLEIEPDEVRDYVRSYVDVRRVEGRRVTGIKMQRGTHGFVLARDPEGTDPLPHGHEFPPE